MAMFLEAHFGEVEFHMPEPSEEPEQGEDSNEASLLVRLDEADARINLVSMVCCSHSPLFSYSGTVAHVFTRWFPALMRHLEDGWRPY